MRKVLFVAVALVLLAGLGFFVWAGLLVGLPEARKRVAVNTRAGDLYAELRKLHQGEPPCLRYPEQVGDAAVREAAQALAQAGLVRSDLSGLVGQFHEWNERLEEPRHASRAEEELFDFLAQDKGLVDRLIVRFYKSRLAEQERKLMDGHRSSAQGTWKRLSTEKQEQVRAVHAEHPAAFTVSGLLRVVRAMSVEATRTRMETLARKIEEFQAASGALERLEMLGPGVELVDDWGAPFDWDGNQLVSLGADRSPGGEGEFADLVRVIGGGAAHPAATAEGPGGCGALPAKRQISRAELDAALSDVARPLGRIVPSFKDGKAQGFKVLSLQEGSLPSRAGFCNLDVVLSVDGLPLTSPDQALEIYSKLKGARQAVFRILRDGAEGELTVVAE